jgi:hypothetical protein
MGGIKDKIAKALGVGFLRLGTRNRMLKKQAQDLLSATPRVPDSSAIAGDVRIPSLGNNPCQGGPSWDASWLLTMGP